MRNVINAFDDSWEQGALLSFSLHEMVHEQLKTCPFVFGRMQSKLSMNTCTHTKGRLKVETKD